MDVNARNFLSMDELMSKRKRSFECELQFDEIKRSRKDTTSTINIRLLDSNLWKQFTSLTNEMIVTRSGRRMFPTINVEVTGLEKKSMYKIFLAIRYENRNRWRFCEGQWAENGEQDNLPEEGRYMHSDSPNYGEHWMSNNISFSKLKLTNRANASNEQVTLKTLHMYVPEVLIYKMIDESEVLVARQKIDCAKFVAVTAYQNEKITLLKIRHNPFAKAFSDSRRRTCDKTIVGEIPLKKQRGTTRIECQDVLAATNNLQPVWNGLESNLCYPPPWIYPSSQYYRNQTDTSYPMYHHQPANLHLTNNNAQQANNDLYHFDTTTNINNVPVYDQEPRWFYA